MVVADDDGTQNIGIVGGCYCPAKNILENISTLNEENEWEA